MYEAFFGLAERPFDLTSNPRYLFLTGTHREALSNLLYGITGQKGVVLMLGEAGTGKTTLIRAAIDQQRSRATLVHLSNPTLSREEFLEFLAQGFALSPAAATSKVRLLTELSTALRGRLDAGGNCALVIDEAQSLPHELLEEVRLLSNLETADRKLLTVILAGQPELAARLNDASLRQLKQRVALRCELRPLELREAAAYIAKRVRVAGGDSSTLFTREAVVQAWRHSRGIPRTINVVCDNALVSGFALGRRPIDVDLVLDVCRDFDLEPADAPAPPPAEVAPPEFASGPARPGSVTRPAPTESTDRTTPVVPARPALVPRVVTPPRDEAPVQAERPVHERQAGLATTRPASILGLAVPSPATPEPDEAEDAAVGESPRRRRFLFF
jgi:general secretion pathway protein A